jgi:hypothetical protein
MTDKMLYMKSCDVFFGDVVPYPDDSLLLRIVA